MKILIYTTFFSLFLWFLCCNDPNLNKLHYADEKYKKINMENLLKEISSNKSQLYLTVDHLLYLTDREIISPDQSKHIWEYLSDYKSRKTDKPNIEQEKNISNKKYIEDPKTKSYKYRQNDMKDLTSFSFIEDLIKEAKKTLNFNQIMMLTILGLLVLGFLLFYLSIFLYINDRIVSLSFLLMLFLYNFLGLAINLQLQLNSIFLPGIIINLCFFIYNAIIHIYLMKLNLQKKLNKFKDIFNVESFLWGKVAQFLLTMFFFYIMMFYFESDLVQIPFYTSCFILVFLISQYYEKNLSKFFWPSWIFFFSCVSIIFIFYFLEFGKTYFLFFGVKGFFIDGFDTAENNFDFQYFGLVFSFFILNFLFPLYLFFQQKKLWLEYKPNDFKLETLYNSIKNELNQETIQFPIDYISFHISGFVSFILLTIGVKIKMIILVIMSLYSLKSYISFIIKFNHLFWRVLFYFCAFCVSNSIFFMGKMKDKYSNHLLSEFKDGNLILFLSIFIRSLMIYYLIDSSTSLYSIKEEINKADSETEEDEDNENEDETKDEEENKDFLEFFTKSLTTLLKFALNYFLVVHLLVLAEEEDSQVISLLFLVLALASFSKLLIYHSLAKQESNRNLISICVYFAGLRLAFLPGRMNSPLYLGSLLSNFSVFASYISFKNLLFVVMSFLMLFGLFLQSYIMESSFALFLALINFSLLFSFLYSKNASTIIYNFLLVLGVILLVFIFSGFSMNFYFKTIGFVIERLIPNTTLMQIIKLSQIEELVEQSFAKQIHCFLMDFFLN